MQRTRRIFSAAKAAMYARGSRADGQRRGGLPVTLQYGRGARMGGACRMIRFSPLRTRRGKERMEQGMTRRWKHAPMRGEKRCTRWKLLRRRKHAPMRAGEAAECECMEVRRSTRAHARGGSGTGRGRRGRTACMRSCGGKRSTHDTAIAQAKHAPMRGGGFFEGLVFLIMPRARAQGKKQLHQRRVVSHILEPCAPG